MSTREIIQSIKQLPFNERLIVIEKTLKTLHLDDYEKAEEDALMKAMTMKDKEEYLSAEQTRKALKSAKRQLGK